jgi:hypothetical protein
MVIENTCIDFIWVTLYFRIVQIWLIKNPLWRIFIIGLLIVRSYFFLSSQKCAKYFMGTVITSGDDASGWWSVSIRRVRCFIYIAGFI